MKLPELDEKDRLILEVIGKNPETPHTEVAKIVNLSQPSVGARIKRMKDLGIVNHTYGINLKNSGMYVLKVDVKCRRPKDLLKLFERCPFLLNGFTVAGNRNLTLLFINEDLSSVEAIVDQHIRSSSDVYDMDVGIIVGAERDTVVPMKVYVKPANEPSCKSNCGDCDYWANDLCLGCPVTGYYRGKIWGKSTF